MYGLPYLVPSSLIFFTIFILNLLRLQVSTQSTMSPKIYYGDDVVVKAPYRLQTLQPNIICVRDCAPSICNLYFKHEEHKDISDGFGSLLFTFVHSNSDYRSGMIFFILSKCKHGRITHILDKARALYLSRILEKCKYVKDLIGREILV